MDALSVHAEEHEHVHVFRLRGTLALPDAPALMSRLADALTDDPRHAAVCDLSEVAPPASDSVLTLFPATVRRVGGWPRCSLRLAAPRSDLAARLSALRMDRYLPVHATLDDAVHHARRDSELERHELPLQPDPAELRTLRRVVRDLWPYPAEHGRDETELIANELAANAIRHVGEPFRVTLAFAPEQVLVAVTDPSRTEPVARSGRRSATHGRGIRVVSRLSRTWGVQLVHGLGKTVWATLPVTPAAAAPQGSFGVS